MWRPPARTARGREQAQPEGEAIQGGDGGFVNDRIIEGRSCLTTVVIMAAASGGNRRLPTWAA